MRGGNEGGLRGVDGEDDLSGGVVGRARRDAEQVLVRHGEFEKIRWLQWETEVGATLSLNRNVWNCM